MIYTRRTNCDSLQVFQSIISIFEIYNLWIREKANNFLFLMAKIKTKLIFWKYNFFFAGNLKSTVFCIALFAKQSREISSLQIELLQFFWSEENSFCRNFSGPKKIQFLAILAVERNWFT